MVSFGAGRLSNSLQQSGSAVRFLMHRLRGLMVGLPANRTKVSLSEGCGAGCCNSCLTGSTSAGNQHPCMLKSAANINPQEIKKSLA